MLTKPSKLTKVIWSIDKKVDSQQMLSTLQNQDWDGLRVVYSKKNAPHLLTFLGNVRKTINRTSPYCFMLDLSFRHYAKISNCPRDHVKKDETIILKKAAESSDDFSISTNFPLKVFKDSKRVILGYGNIELEITGVTDSEISTKVISEGDLYPGQFLYFPELPNNYAFSYLEELDLQPFIDKGVYYFIVSGRYLKEEIEQFKAIFNEKYGFFPWVLAKIESDQAVANVENIMEACEGLLISRMELSLTVKPSQVPILSRKLINLARHHSKTAIVASEILRSMEKNPTPTRAEVSDIAGTVMEGADGIILSENITSGAYSQNALKVLNDTIIDIETNMAGKARLSSNYKPPIRDEMDAVSFGAFKAVRRSNASAIVCISHGGNTALKLASFIPQVPIITVTFDKKILDKIALVSGVTGIYLKQTPNIDDILIHVNKLLKEKSWLKVGDIMVFVSVTISSLANTASNLFTIQRIE